MMTGNNLKARGLKFISRWLKNQNAKAYKFLSFGKESDKMI